MSHLWLQGEGGGGGVGGGGTVEKTKTNSNPTPLPKEPKPKQNTSLGSSQAGGLIRGAQQARHNYMVPNGMNISFVNSPAKCYCQVMPYVCLCLLFSKKV